jgi:hypothetical protein
VPIGVHIKENPAGFHRFDSVWTPTPLVLDENGKERHRIDGYLTHDKMVPHEFCWDLRVSPSAEEMGGRRKALR